MASSSAASPVLGWIGLGSMGIGMASNLQKHLCQNQLPSLHYHNRTMSRGAPLQDLGGIPASNIEDLVASASIIFMSLSDDAALSATLDALLASKCREHLKARLFVDTSTVLPYSSSEAQRRLAEHGARFVAAPVFGASPVAAKGQLLWVVAGSDHDAQAISPYIVGVMGRGVIRLGEDVEQSSLLKTAGNFVTAGMMEVIAEAHVFAEKTGLGSATMEALLEQQYGQLAHSMSQRLTTGAYLPPRGERPWSDLDLAIKDVGHGIRCAQENDAMLPVAELALGHLKTAREYGREHERKLDSSSMYGVLRLESGLAFENDVVRKRDAQDD